MPTIEIDEDEFRNLLNERDRLRKQVSDLQSAGTALVELRREGDVTYNVGAFHAKFGYPSRPRPTIVIPDSEIKLRARLENEEHFEVLDGFFGYLPELLRAEELVNEAIELHTPAPDLVKIADGLCDRDYIAEGTRQYFGIPRVAILKEVQRANMAKEGGPIRADGKILKPAGWTPPDIAGVLRAHGWDD